MFSSSPPRTSSPPPADDEDVDMVDVDSPIAIDSPVDSEFGGSFSGRSSNVSLSRPPRSPGRHTLARNRPQNIVPAVGDGGGDMNVELSSDNFNTGQVIWGTDINIERATARFYAFVNEFQRDGNEMYRSLIEDAIEMSSWNINLDAQNVYEFDQTLYRQLVMFPQEMIPILDSVVSSYAQDHFQEELEEALEAAQHGANFAVRPFNLRSVESMRNMNPEDIDKLVSIRGMVIRATGIIPDISEAFFQCTVCQQTQTVPIDMGRIQEPSVCSNLQCQSKLSMRMEHNRCQFLDKQLIKVQETPEAIPDGETPQTIDVYCYDDMVDVCKPGDRVEITGVYRARPIRMNPRRRTVESVFRVYIDGVHFRKTSANQFSVESHQSTDPEFFTSFEESDTADLERQNRLERIKELAIRDDIYELLVRSFAPSIYEMDDVKKGILCQLFGASRKDFTDVGGGRFRSQLNVLLCGDPGTSKSQLLQYVHKVAPRGIYTSGKGSSAVGLTAYVSKDPETRDIVLESGALVLSDRGICCIDEFDKMSDSARSILHEVMEQQTISVAKAGIICELNARTSILAAANPIESRYNPNKSVVENIDLPSTLMSRFDLIYLVLDNPNEVLDRRLARHIVALYYHERDRDEEEDEKEMMDTETFMEYISYCRREIHPKLTDDACAKLIDGYCEMRSIGRHAGRKVITATPRQLESLIRISESLARMRQSETVVEEDVEEAIRLHKVATLQAATDPRTGAIDMNIITSGRSRDEEQRIKKMADIVLDVLQAVRKRSIRFKQLMKRYNKKVAESDVIAWTDLKKVIEYLEKQGNVRPSDMMADDPVITIIRSD